MTKPEIPVLAFQFALCIFQFLILNSPRLRFEASPQRQISNIEDCKMKISNCKIECGDGGSPAGLRHKLLRLVAAHLSDLHGTDFVNPPVVAGLFEVEL